MPLWGGNNLANNDPKFSADLVNKGSGDAAKATIRQNMYQNTTPNVFTNKQTVSIVFVTAEQIRTKQVHVSGGPGWYLRRIGSGGRSNRKQYESLVSMAGMKPIMFAPYGAPTGYHWEFVTSNGQYVTSNGQYTVVLVKG